MAAGAPAAAVVPQPRSPADHGRTSWLDGVRFAAAMFVVVHHCWLWAFPGFPRNTGPWYLGWMLYGQLAVVVFIVVSGYSLTIAPARNGFKLRGGARTFAKRRAWRILPPYWAALVLSVLVFAFVAHPDTSAQTAAKSFAVYGLLVQDIVNSASPNGAFWSIAVEAQIYLLFPLMLFMRRRYGAVMTAAIVTVVAAALEVLAHHVSVFARYDNLTPQLAVAFAFGMAVVDAATSDRFKGRRIPMLGLSGLLLAIGVVAMNRLGSQTIVEQYFWVDILAGVITAIAFRGLAGPARSRVREFFQSRPMVAGGRFSYSIYLIHLVVLDFAAKYVVAPLHLGALSSFGLLLLIVVPGALIASYGFYVVFERPFIGARSADAFRPLLQRLRSPFGNTQVAAEPASASRTREA